MCFFRGGGGGSQPLPQPAPILSRTNAGLEASPLPTKKELVDPDEIQGIEYGSQRKKPTAAAGKKTGTAALRIPLNTGAGTGTGGGLNP